MWVPAGTPPGARLPAIVIGHGYGGSKEVGEARTAAARGYVGFAFTARGFGDSDGQMDVVGPRTMQDLKELVRWLVAHGPVDPARVGFVGASYGGGHAMQIAAEPDGGIATVVAVATWSDLHHGLIPNGVPKFSYTTGFYVGGHGLVQDGDEPTGVPVVDELGLGRRCICDSYAPEIHRWYVEGALDAFPEDAAQGLRQRSVIHRAANVRVPIYMIQGLSDDLFSGEQVIDLLPRLGTSEARVHLGFVGHPRAVASGPELAWLRGEVAEWFDHYLKGIGPRPFDPTRPIELADERWNGRVASLARWPAGEEGQWTPFTAAGGLVEADAGATAAFPIANTVVAGGPDDAAAASLSPEFARLPAGTPADTLTFRSGPLQVARTILGTPRAELVVTSTSPKHMVAVKVFDRAPDGSVALVTRGVFGVREGAPGVPQRLAFDLQPYHHTFEAGHEVEVRVAASDFPAYLPARAPFTTLVHVGGAGGSGVRLPWA